MKTSTALVLIVFITMTAIVILTGIVPALRTYEVERTKRMSSCAQVGGSWLDRTGDCISPRSDG